MNTRVEVYNRGNGFNFRLIVKSNLKDNVIFSTRQCYEHKAEALKIAGKIKYEGEQPPITVLKKYYRIK